jgi:high-affinity Fe2+/Pb2+ permease
MDMPSKSPRSGRETALTFALVGVLGGAFFLFLNLVSFGIFFYVLAAVVGIAALGFLHYVVWGYDLSEEVAEERQREWLQQQAEMDER